VRPSGNKTVGLRTTEWSGRGLELVFLVSLLQVLGSEILVACHLYSYPYEYIFLIIFPVKAYPIHSRHDMQECDCGTFPKAEIPRERQKDTLYAGLLESAPAEERWLDSIKVRSTARSGAFDAGSKF
jgi:hypothetical protein